MKSALRNKTILSLLLMFIVINSTTLGFAFWDFTIQEIENEIPLGERAIIEVTETVNPSKKLVPLGSFKGSNEIDEYTFEYVVTFNKQGRLRVSIDLDTIKIGTGDHQFNNLVVVQIFADENTHGNYLNNELVTNFSTYDIGKGEFSIMISIRVFVDGPSNPNDYEAAYFAVAGQTITFNALFEALENE